MNTLVTYKYQAISKNGQKVNGVVDAFNEMDAVERIKVDCDIVLKVVQVDKKESILNKDIGGNKLNAKAFTLMCSQFSIILRSGVPIARTVSLIAEKTTNKPLKKVLKSVAEDVEAGRGLADSFQERGSKLLPMIFIETIRAGEESGNMDRAFETMYQHYDKQTKIRSKVRSALIYPIFVLAVAIGVVIVLMVKVVPTFLAVFEFYDSELPLMTRILISISNFFRHYWIVMIVIIIVLILAYKIYGNTEQGRLKLAKLGIRLPVLGPIIWMNAASQFANTLTTLIGSGLSITRAISITARVIDNYYVSQEVGKISGRLEEGHTLGDSMRESACLPDILVDMVAVGEETGELEDTLNTTAAYYDSELTMAVENALKKLEPSILIFLAVVAGFIVIAIYMSMFEMYAVM